MFRRYAESKDVEIRKDALRRGEHHSATVWPFVDVAAKTTKEDPLIAICNAGVGYGAVVAISSRLLERIAKGQAPCRA